MTDKHSKRSGGITRRFAIISLLLFLLGACTMPIQGSDQGQSFSAQIVAPSNGKTVALGTTLEVETRVSSPGVVTSVTLLVNGQTEREDRFSNPAFHSGVTYQSWTPPAVGTYLLQVILQDTKGQVSSNEVTVIVVEGAPISMTPPIEPLDISTETPTITVTLAPEKPQVTANQDVNCRRGPSTAYPELGALLTGETVPVVGRNQDQSWFYVELNGTQCWVWSEAVTVKGNVDESPIITPPPLPITETPSPVPAYSACHDYPDLATCGSDPMGFGGCSWDTGTNKCQP